MVFYTWILKNRIATANMPTSDEIAELSKIFDAVIVLVKDYELEYNINLWRKFNVEYIHLPVPDFHAPQILELYHIVKWIKEKISQGKKVLIHCYGGLGRSGTVAAAYLMYSRNMAPWNAISYVRRKKSRSIESLRQINLLEIFNLILKLIPEPKLSLIDAIGMKYNYGRGIKHASKVTELSVKLWKELNNYLKLNEHQGLILASSSILHDIGIYRSLKNHHKYALELIENEKEMLNRLFTNEEITLIKWSAYYHRIEAGDPKDNDGLRQDLKEDVRICSAILRIADALDYTLNQSVKDIKISKKDERYIFKVYCEIPYEWSILIRRALEKSSLLKEVIGNNIFFTVQ